MQLISFLHESNDHNDDNDNDVFLMDSIKRIKQTQKNSKFSDVFVTAIGQSLKRYFQRNSYQVPEQITGVIPIRMEGENLCEPVLLQNRFSVAQQIIPIRCLIDDDDNDDWSSTEINLRNITECADKLRTSYEYQVIKIVKT